MYLFFFVYLIGEKKSEKNSDSSNQNGRNGPNKIYICLFPIRRHVPARPQDAREHHPAAVCPRLRRGVRLLELQPGWRPWRMAERRLPHPEP